MKSPDESSSGLFLILMRVRLAQHIAALGVLIENDGNVWVLDWNTAFINQEILLADIGNIGCVLILS